MRVVMNRVVFSAVTIGVVGATVFRVASAPDRIEERKAVARNVCIENGGQWVNQGRDAICVKAERISGKG